MVSRGADTFMLQYTDWLLDLAFLTNITGKLNHLKCEIQGKGKTISDTLSAVNAFQSQDKPFLHIFTELQYVKCDMDSDMNPDVVCDPDGLGRACACASRCHCVGRQH